MIARDEDTPARREVRDRIREGEPPNSRERADLIALAYQKLPDRQRREAIAFIRRGMKTQRQLRNLRARLESL